MTDQTADIQIRQLSAEEFSQLHISAYAFNASPTTRTPSQNEERLERFRRYGSESQPYALFENGTPMASLALHTMTQNVRGGVIPMSGVGGVASLPAGRRRGYVRQLMTHAYRQMKDNGHAISTLYPFRESFYERLGYAGLQRPHYITVHPKNLIAISRVPKPGSIRHCPMEDGFDEWRAFLETYQRETHGFSLRHVSSSVRLRDENTAWILFVHEDDQITGAMTYRITGYTKDMLVDTFYTRTVAARYHFLEWIARHLDQVEHVRIKLLPTETPELWANGLDIQHISVIDDDWSWPTPMCRIVDLAALNGHALDHEATAEVTIEVTDEHAPWNAGVWHVASEGGTLRVTAAPNNQPTTTLTIQGLTALLFTGIDPEAIPYRGWGAVSHQEYQPLRVLFPSATPFLHEEF